MQASRQSCKILSTSSSEVVDPTSLKWLRTYQAMEKKAVDPSLFYQGGERIVRGLRMRKNALGRYELKSVDGRDGGELATEHLSDMADVNGSRSGFWPSVFLEAWGNEAQKPHIFWKSVFFGLAAVGGKAKKQ
jgi:hypothetical protein